MAVSHGETAAITIGDVKSQQLGKIGQNSLIRAPDDGLGSLPSDDEVMSLPVKTVMTTTNPLAVPTWVAVVAVTLFTVLLVVNIIALRGLTRTRRQVRELTS